MELTKDILRGCMPKLSNSTLEKYFEYLQYYCRRFEINTPLRISHFLSQIGHESGNFYYTHELGNSAYFKKYDTGNLAKMLGNTPEADGDGEKYKGRGLIQITGKANYTKFSEWYYGKGNMTFVNKPEEVENNKKACVASAFWFWNTRCLNKLADQDDVLAITKKVNGGTNGLADRKARLETCKKYFNIK